MSKLSGIKDIDLKIISNLNDIELGKVCQVNKYVSQLCEDENFWRERLINKYKSFLIETDNLQEYKDWLNFTWKEFYQFLYEIGLRGYNTDFIYKKIYTIFNWLRNKWYIDDVIIPHVVSKKLPRWINREVLLRDIRHDLLEIVSKDNYIDLPNYFDIFKTFSINYELSYKFRENKPFFIKK